MTEPNNGKELILHCGRVVTPARVLENATVILAAGRIQRVSVSKVDADVGGSQEIDLQGTTIFPGFIDVHIHGAVGVDTVAATSDDLLSVSRFLATRGVTGWLPTLVPAPGADYENAVTAIEGSMKQEAEAGRALGARVLGVHYEGPFVNAMQCGALRSEHFKTYAEPSDVAALPIPKDQGTVWLMTLAPEIEGGIELVAELVSRGWVASIGHTRATVEVLDRAFAAGAKHMTHFMNAMAPFNHRAPGPVGWGLARDDATCDIIADGIHLDPFVLRLLMKAKGADRLLLISDAIAAAGKGDGEYNIWGETITVKDRRTSNSRGSIAGSVITMLDAARMMLSLGASEPEVARMSSTNPARLLRLDKDCGAIQEGKRADLVALDRDGNVRLTVIGGRIAYQRQ
ncbi:MAG: N-acetylglucosamine-6-phosphate deacetylase [Pyrinomonadaceae bacterium]|nr:N-acetylglucosamine-6-phosphate deacetylase [Pyrinomonadaceae bacterium]